MKYKLLFSIILFIFSSRINAQNNNSDMEVVYRMKFIIDSTKTDYPIYVDNLRLLFNEESSVYFSQDTKSYYEFINKGISQMKDGKISLGSIPMQPKVKGSVYRVGETITATLPVGKYLYSFEEPKIEWQLLNDIKEIKGIKCGLAKTTLDTGGTFYAWYTINEYPFSEGPFRFKGLPGLILSVYNKNKTIEIDAVEIKKTQTEFEHYFSQMAIKIKNKAIFLKARREYFENPNIQRNQDIIIKDSNGSIINNNRMERLPNNVFLD
ncbi:GLPGLI family protein [Chryseobacterium sp. Ch-15]|uniref:GLPGLI family protein n=1 Tax=Chryseobacterium muglaense TaxID=2893752 RepID=A0A9Q3V0Q8_9FLAO|nr:GLPGLI family protein [Chryseobacterium muglaense]MBD3906397.1 GLPGLI family protein [Chryseobacterium muglaense]MCC9037080.1 GLPGLI family protein [Chryseobacterium muglaense]MCM2556629.1 GLPGLI family protein [Chryseobacterium muglaense]